MTPWLEPAALFIVLFYVVLQARREAEPRRFLLRLLLTAVSGFLVEESCIRLYGFYDYSPEWSVKIMHLPLLVLLIWPVVIHSAGDLARGLFLRGRRGGAGWLALVGGALVFLDAAAIEPISVHSGLWYWTEPGLFDVPPIGIIGWGFFGGLCLGLFEHTSRRPPAWDLLVLPVALLGTHLLLLGAWWGALRWVNGPVSADAAVMTVWIAGAIATLLALRHTAGAWLKPPSMLLRIPAASFFVVLLVTHWPGLNALFWYFLAFNPPNILLTAQSVKARLREPAPRA